MPATGQRGYSPPGKKLSRWSSAISLPNTTMISILVSLLALIISYVIGQGTDSSCKVTTQALTEPPYSNYFYSDCNVDAQVVVTSPLPDSNLTIIGPRLIVAWPAGNSGICTFFRPQNGINGSLGIELVNSTFGTPLSAVDRTVSGSQYPSVGVESVISFNSTAELNVHILGSVRTIRDFTEGPSILVPLIQNAVNITQYNQTGVSYSRLWLDNVTVSTITFTPYNNASNNISINGNITTFPAGLYRFSASFNYPQLTQLTPQQVLNNQSQGLITSQQEQTTSLSFLSYSEKLLAGAWRFLTYFGRDSMISALLLEPVLSSGNGSAMEAVIGAVLERINRTDGSVCHEETIGDYATYQNLLNNMTSTVAGFTYPMIDTDYYLAPLMMSYFVSFPTRIQPLLSTMAGKVDVTNANLTWGQLAYINAQKIVNITAAFEQNQTVANLIHLHPNEIVGEWRDSTYGLGNGRVPFDVNCALVPAALRALAALSTIQGIFPNSSFTSNWSTSLLTRAQVWEDNTLQFFETTIPLSTAATNLQHFTNTSTFYNGPDQSSSLSTYSTITTNGTTAITSYTLALGNSTNSTQIPILHTDTAFRLFLLTTSTNQTNQTQLTRFVNSTASDILRPFPAGLTTPLGLVVANPALLSSDPVYTANFTNSAYHGTVVWSWQLALMAKGLERQLSRCNISTTSNTSSSITTAIIPNFCNDTTVYPNVRAAYNRLWDTIDANQKYLQGEVWSWTYTTPPNDSSSSSNSTGGYTYAPLGSLPPPPGVSGGTESNIRQLWSLTFLAVTRNEALR